VKKAELIIASIGIVDLKSTPASQKLAGYKFLDPADFCQGLQIFFY
jgi:hypothetical protein